MPNDWGDEAANDWGDKPAAAEEMGSATSLDAAPSHIPAGMDVPLIDRAKDAALEVALGPFHDSKTDTGKGIEGVKDASLTGLTGMAAYPAGLVAGAVDLLRGKGYDAAKRQRQLVEEYLTRQPKTAEGAQDLAVVAKAMEPVTESAKWAGGKVTDLTGSRMLGGAVEEGINLAPAVAMSGAVEALTVLPKVRPPRLQRTSSAELLRSHGVEGLTTGQQLGPKSFLAQLESAAADNWAGLGRERAAAEQSWRGAVIRQALEDPKSPLPKDTAAALSEVHSRFDPQYAEIRGQSVPASAVADLPENAIRMPGGVDAATRKAVANEVGNALTTLEGVEWHPPGMHGGGGKLVVRGLTPEAPEPFAVTKPARGGEAYRGGEFPAPPERGSVFPPDRKEMLARALERARTRQHVGPVEERLIPGTTRPNPNYEWRTATEAPTAPPQFTAGDLMRVRTNIREGLSAARTAQDFERVNLLKRAEGLVTKAIESGLSPEEAATLKAIDRRYAIYSTIEEAAPRGGHDFTPKQLLRANERAVGRRAAKHGRGGVLQELGEAADETFVNAPYTGGRGAVMSWVPWGAKIAAPLSRTLNLPGVQRMMFEPRGVPIASLAERLSRGLSPNAIRAGAPVSSRLSSILAPHSEPVAPSLPVGLTPAAAVENGVDVPVHRSTPAPTEGQQGHDEEQTPQHPADLAPRGEVAQPPSEDEAPTRHVSVTDRLASVLQSNPGALGQYAGPIAMRLRFGGPLALAQYDFVEQQRSPEYRAQRAKAIGDERLSLKSS